MQADLLLVAALACAEINGQAYLVAGGSDDGLTLFQMLPGGRLLALTTLADTLQMGLSNISALSLRATATGLDIFAASAAEPGITQVHYTLGTAGVTLHASSAGGTLTGGAGADILCGGFGADLLIGGSGDDIVLDGDGSDQMQGGIGADTINGGLGIDSMVGGSGSDTYIIDSTADIIVELLADAARQERFASAGRHKVEREFNIRVEAGRLLDHFGKACNA